MIAAKQMLVPVIYRIGLQCVYKLTPVTFSNDTTNLVQYQQFTVHRVNIKICIY